MMTNKKIIIFLVAALFILAFSSCSKKHRSGFQSYPESQESVAPDVKFLVGSRDGTILSSISVGFYHTCSVTSSGAAQCWGQNVSGQLGDGTTTDSTTPINVSGLSSGILAISAGGNGASDAHSCALTSTGTVKCWGNNSDGRLGDGTQNDSTVPVDVANLDGVREVTAGGEHTCALDIRGRVFCWGENAYGQLGNGIISYFSTTPVQVKGLTGGGKRNRRNNHGVAAGGHHACAITSKQEVSCWGDNSSSQVGQSDANPYFIPAKVAGIPDNVTALAAGWEHTCAVTELGQVFCWGDNKGDQLGQDSVGDSYTPLLITGLPADVVDVAAGDKHTCALTGSGAVWCWGNNGYGQLGYPTDTANSIPVQVSGLNGQAVALSAGGNTTCAQLSTGEVQCWGEDQSGKLGNGGGTVDTVTPTSVVGLTALWF